MRTGILVHGLNLHSADWYERALFGEPPYKLGRAGRAIQLLYTTYPDTELMIFGSGASEKGHLKEGDYTIRQLLENYETVRQFEAFRDLSWVHGRSLFKKLSKIAKSELRATNTYTESAYAIPRFFDQGIRQIVIVSDLAHISRCLAHAAEIVQKNGLEGEVELVAEHSGYRHPKQDLGLVKVFEPETEPEADIQLGSMASELFRIKKGSRAEFKKECDALIRKYST